MAIRPAAPLVLALTALLTLTGAAGARPAGPAPAAFAAGTHWTVRTSEGFDALCALNVLSGDSFYVAEYPRESKVFEQQRYAAARREARALARLLKRDNGHIVSAFLTLVLSGGPDSTLDAVIASTRDVAAVKAAFRASPYADDGEWALYERARPLVQRALEAMRTAGFHRDWSAHMRTKGAARRRELLARLVSLDVLGEQARLLGHPLQEGRIEVILLWYSRPHGIRIQGPRFLTNEDYPAEIVLRNAAHEPLHPPYETRDPAIAAAVTHLAADSLIAHIVRTHDPSFGYNDAAGYVEEDAVQALEQVVSERLGFAQPAAERWREGDDGMHLLAAALYDAMRESGFAEQGGRFDLWFAQAVAAGELDGAGLRRRAAAVVGEAALARWSGAAR